MNIKSISMKTISIYFRLFILLVSLCSLVFQNGYAQGTDSRKKTVKEGKMYIGITLDPVQTKISNEDFSSVLNIKKGNSLNFACIFGYFFSSKAGLTIGAGYSSYSSDLSLDSTSIRYQTIDSENESFEMRIKGLSVVESQKISMLSFPICAYLRFPVSEKIGVFLKPGLSFNIPISKSYDSNGTFTYDGYYADYPVLLQNLPEYGLPSNLSTNSSGTLELKSLTTALIVSGGISYSIKSQINLLFGVCFSKSLGNISAYTADPGYKLSSKANELNSFMAGSSGAGYQSIGISLGFIYYLK
jgi:hypothetical protein